MKKLINNNVAVLVLALFVLQACTSFVSPSNKPIEEGGEIMEVNNVSKDDIYKNIRQWFASNFTSGKDAVKYDSKEEGTIISNGYVYFSRLFIFTSVSYIGEYTLRVDVKDGRVKVSYSINNVSDVLGGLVKGKESEIAKIREVVKSKMQDMKDFILTKEAQTDW